MGKFPGFLAHARCPVLDVSAKQAEERCRSGPPLCTLHPALRSRAAPGRVAIRPQLISPLPLSPLPLLPGVNLRLAHTVPSVALLPSPGGRPQGL